LQTLQDPRWTQRTPPEHYGVRVFDLVSPDRPAATASGGVAAFEAA